MTDGTVSEIADDVIAALLVAIDPLNDASTRRRAARLAYWRSRTAAHCARLLWQQQDARSTITLDQPTDFRQFVIEWHDDRNRDRWTPGKWTGD